MYVFQLMDHYTAVVSLMFLAFFEVLAVCWVFGNNLTFSPIYDEIQQPVVYLYNTIKTLCFIDSMYV